ncbi:20 kDa protein [Rice Tombus-like virus 1]|nr:20 kDa protein [Rice Tombus-like virus 1]
MVVTLVTQTLGWITTTRPLRSLAGETNHTRFEAWRPHALTTLKRIKARTANVKFPCRTTRRTLRVGRNKRANVQAAASHARPLSPRTLTLHLGVELANNWSHQIMMSVTTPLSLIWELLRSTLRQLPNQLTSAAFRSAVPRLQVTTASTLSATLVHSMLWRAAGLNTPMREIGHSCR